MERLEVALVGIEERNLGLVLHARERRLILLHTAGDPPSDQTDGEKKPHPLG
jgi:hypothetical protein